MPYRLPFLFFPLALAALLLPTTDEPAARADLAGYVKKADPAFSWKLAKNHKVEAGTIYRLHLVSQKWQGITWKHTLDVYVPKDVKPGATMFLWNQGGRPSPFSMDQGLKMAEKMQAPVAYLYAIPNQPLLDGKIEDALIAETFVRYLKTKDEDWPLLFPMVKSLVKAMDALQAFARAQWKVEVKQFIVSGGSKRGWTTWLTGVVDPRVKAIAPLVIDTLNMPKQMDHQLASFGAYSKMIHDYTKRGLVPAPKTAEAQKLWSMVDPWFYRAQLRMPKLIVNGTNDPYWTLDALNLYWDDLQGDKWVLYVPNAGHNLQQKKKLSDKIGDGSRALNTLAAFTRHQITGKPMPKMQWKVAQKGGTLRMTVGSSPAPLAARWWVADATTKDFRKARWTSRPATIRDGSIVGQVGAPSAGCRAIFAELDFRDRRPPLYAVVAGAHHRQAGEVSASRGPNTSPTRKRGNK
jgi:PhoPQ-activated pathogenicity-related protein